eukprot:333350-Amorphochlora_amoeboformis.AAC.2
MDWEGMKMVALFLFHHVTGLVRDLINAWASTPSLSRELPTCITGNNQENNVKFLPGQCTCSGFRVYHIYMLSTTVKPNTVVNPSVDMRKSSGSENAPGTKISD